MPTIDPFWREWRQAWAARRLVLAVADAEGGPLTDPKAGSTPDSRAAAACSGVENRFGQLARPPSPDDAAATRYLRTRLAYLARACGAAGRSGSDELLGTAVALWGDAVRCGGLRERLERRAPTLAGPGGGARLCRLVKDALWEAEAGDGVATKQRRRKWKGVRDVSLEILPNRGQDGQRCTQAHFEAIAEQVRRTRPHDRNLPRSSEAVGELFYLFCPCCVGVADPRLPGYAGPVRGCGHGAVEENAAGGSEGDGFELGADEGVAIMIDVAPRQAAVMVAKFKTLVAAQSPRDQVVLSNLIGEFAILGRTARRAYPTLDAEAVKSRDRTAAVLGVTWQELAEDRRRMDGWLSDVSRRLQHGPPPAKGAE